MPQRLIPPVNVKLHGIIRNINSRLCWRVTDDYIIALTEACDEYTDNPEITFTLTYDGLMKYHDKCIKILEPIPYLGVVQCPSNQYDKDEVEKFGYWELQELYNFVNGFIKVKRRNEAGEYLDWCIAQMYSDLDIQKGEQMPLAVQCNSENEFEKWAFSYGFDIRLVPSAAMELATVPPRYWNIQ